MAERQWAGGRQFELEVRQKEVGRGWERQRMGRKDRWMWSDAGTTPDTWHTNREVFTPFIQNALFHLISQSLTQEWRLRRRTLAAAVDHVDNIVIALM